MLKLKLLIMLGMLLPCQALANMAAPWEPSPLYGEAVAGTGDLEISRETLSFDLTPLSSRSPARVSVTYLIRNPGPELSTELAFVSPGIKDPEVTLDSRRLTTRDLEDLPLPEAWQAPTLSPALGDDPEGYQIHYLTGRHGEDDTGSGFLFFLTVPQGEHELRVTYDHYPAAYHGRGPYLVHQVAYVLAPAASWKSFGSLEISVRIPQGWDFASDPALSCDGGICTGRFDRLPGSTLAFSLQAPVPWDRVKLLEIIPWALLGLAVILALLLGLVLGGSTGSRMKLALRGAGLTAFSMILAVIIVLGGYLQAKGLLLDPQQVTRTFSYINTMGTGVLTLLAAACSMFITLLTGLIRLRMRQRAALNLK